MQRRPCAVQRMRTLIGQSMRERLMYVACLQRIMRSHKPFYVLSSRTSERTGMLAAEPAHFRDQIE